MRLVRLVALGVSVAATGYSPATAATPAAPITTTPVCFVGHAAGGAVAVYGVRYQSGTDSPARRAVVLVHGTDSTHEVWDFPVGYSVARDLAAAGYVVFAYDQPGFGASQAGPFPAGDEITAFDGRESLHDVVQQVRSGAYTLPTSSDGCTEPGTTSGIASASVVIMGHSYGGLLVSGYAGTYHDVDGMVQIDADNFGFSPAFYVHLVDVAAAVAMTPTDDHMRVFLKPEDCEQFLVYAPGIDPALMPGICDLSHRVPAPRGVGATTAGLVALNPPLIAQTGPSVPVLLAFADHEAAFDPSAMPNEVQYWRDHCGCDVTSWVQPEAGHAFMWHRTMPLFIDEVTGWMAAHGLGA
jgi:pimeloyl-ACP methyl ester carboxylesterase